ncbi:MAG: sulfatase-like hydrolase/transferase [Lautropia sp.]
MSRTNLLVILSDEHQAGMIASAGDPIVSTPNLDRLCRRGTRFANAYTPSPICVPARASLATGLPVHLHRCWDNALAWDGSPEGWGHRLRRAGVRVESIGKLHFRDAASDCGFDRQGIPLHVAAGLGQVWGSVRDPLPASAGRSPLFDEIGPGDSRYNRYDRDVTALACRWLAEEAPAGDRPWVLFVGLVAPHFPLVVGERWLSHYPSERMPLPRLLPRDGHARHPWVERMARFMDHDASFDDAVDGPTGDARRRLAIACYLGLVSFMDDCVGRILAALEAGGLAASTTVVYSSDHGDNLGARGLWNKCTLYRESSGVPMIVAGPDVPAGRVCETPVSLLDIHDTALACAGVAAPAIDASSVLASGAPLERASLVDLARHADRRERLALCEYHAVGSDAGAFRLCDADWAFHQAVGYAPELFDLRRDPGEAYDLAGDPVHARELARWRDRLASLLDPVAVDRAAKRDQAALVARVGGRECALQLGPRGASPVPPDALAPADAASDSPR